MENSNDKNPEPENKWDVVIIGAGPAGMFAAYTLINEKPDLKILLIDEGFDIDERVCPMMKTLKCAECEICSIMCGVGGAGTYSDGTLNLRPDIGGDLAELTKSESEAWKLVDEVDGVFLKFGAPDEVYGRDAGNAEDLKYKAAAAGIKFIEIKQRHMGTDRAPLVIAKFENYLKDRGVNFMVNTRVIDLLIEKQGDVKICRGIACEKTGKTDSNDRAEEDKFDNEIYNKKIKIYGKFIIAALGRVGTSWINKFVERHGIDAKPGPIDVGVRVEVPAIIMKPVVKINRDPKFHIWTEQYGDFVRTFCTNHEGFVVKERYEDFIGVNGHSMKDRKSENTNFAFLVRVVLTEPVENTALYGRSIAKLATRLGGGKPLIQRLGDFKRGRRSTFSRLKRSNITNTLEDVTPGSIAMVLPHKIMTDIIEGLEKLNLVIPGVAADSTFLYAPEVKFYSMLINVDPDMQTSIKGLFAAGDGAGLSRDIVNASATGILAGRGILRCICEGGM